MDFKTFDDFVALCKEQSAIRIPDSVVPITNRHQLNSSIEQFGGLLVDMNGFVWVFSDESFWPVWEAIKDRPRLLRKLFVEAMDARQMASVPSKSPQEAAQYIRANPDKFKLSEAARRVIGASE